MKFTVAGGILGLGILLFGTSQGIAQSPGGIELEAGSVADVRKTVLAKPDATAAENQGWLVVQEGLTMWTFAPQGHESHPAVVKRSLVQTADGGWTMSMRVRCQATKVACDRLVASFEKLNEEMRRAIAADRTKAP